VPQSKNISPGGTVDIGMAVAKACCIEHTGQAGFSPEDDWRIKQNSSIFADLETVRTSCNRLV
jgi:hypothetical protein